MLPYDPNWARSFQLEAQRLEPVLGSYVVQPIEHIGSTAVRGLMAKPIIDMLAVVEHIEAVGGAMVGLAEVGWLAAPEPGDASDQKLSFCLPSVELRTHHLHVVEARSTDWRGCLAFRDYLRDHPVAILECGELKTRLAILYGGDPNERDAYRAGKASWIRNITEQALPGSRDPAKGGDVDQPSVDAQCSGCRP
jgi:GrpB-like predicted nucleotidyltransferase (UPF0157 family)